MKENPGEFPYTRGLYPGMYQDKPWSIRQYAGFTSAEESNKRYKYLLEQGVTGLSVAFDLPTQIGYDSDHPMAEGEVGKVGVPITSIQDMDILFDGIELDDVSTSMTINATAPILFALYLVGAENQGVPAEKLKGTVQNDILKEYIARGTYIFPPKPSMRLVTDLLEFCTTHAPYWNTVSISGYHIREAGSTAAQELAFTLANGISYVAAAIAKGLDPNQFACRISFFFNAHNDFLIEIAKFRAARKLWATIMKNRFGVSNNKVLKCRFHTQTGGSTLTASQIDNNVVRTTIQALSAVLGSTQSLHTNSRDEALALPTDKSAKLALRTQQIIAHESDIPEYPDPFGGSHVIESMTADLAEEATKIIKTIDGLGGSVSAIEQGYIQNEISRSAYEYQKNIDKKNQIIVGVNDFIDEDTLEPETQSIDHDKIHTQINSIKSFKQQRNNDQVKLQLDSLKLKAQSPDNLMPAIISCVKNTCTLGEISDTLRDIYGEYQDS